MLGTEEVIRRILVILGTIAEAEGPMTVREIASRSGFGSSSVHRFMVAMEGNEALVKDIHTGLCGLGPIVLDLGFAALRGMDVRRLALPYLEKLRQSSDETVGLCIRVGDSRVYIEQLESSHELKALVSLGERYPLYSGAPGHALLALMSDDELDRFFARVEVVPPNPTSPADESAVREAVAGVRSCGYAIGLGQTMPGVRAVAVPISRGGYGSPDATLTVTGPAERFSEDSIELLLPELLDVAGKLSRSLGSAGKPISQTDDLSTAGTEDRKP